MQRFLQNHFKTDMPHTTRIRDFQQVWTAANSLRCSIRGCAQVPINSRDKRQTGKTTLHSKLAECLCGMIRDKTLAAA
jgi:hypothetical protein